MTSANRFCWSRYRPTPAAAIPLLLALEALLFLADRYRFWCGQWKGCSVLLGCAAVLATLLMLFLWFAVSLVCRRRFQFRLFSLFMFLTCSALPFSWLAWDIKLANRQRDDVAAFRNSRMDAQ